MEDSEVKSLLDKNLEIVKIIEHKATMFGKSMLVLSLLDVVFGVLAIFCTSLSLIALFASATSLTAITIFGRVIQISKIRQLEKSLKAMEFLSISWFVNKYQKYLKKKEKGKVKTTKLSKIQIAAIIGAILGFAFGIVSVFMPQIQIAGNVAYNLLVATGVDALCALAGTFKGYAERTEEEIAKIREKQAEKEKALKDAEYKKALAFKEEYDKANAIIAAHEQNK